SEREALAVVEPLGESGARPEAENQPAIQPEPKSDESLPAQRESGPALDLSLCRRDAEVPTELDRSTSLAAVETLRVAGRDVAGSSGGHSELLPDEGAAGGG